MVFWIPRVWEKSGTGEREYDLFSRLLRDRIIFIGSEITDHLANLVVAQMLFLQSENKSQDINLYLNSPGGDIPAGLAIYDTMQFVQCDVATYCTGSASSMAALLLTAGTRGKRYALPHAQIMIHQPWGRVAGVASEIHIHAEEMLYCRKRMNELLAKHTGQTEERVNADSDRDRYLSAAEALDYGMVDEVVTTLRQEKD
ncbi:MAG: ATP-dependent Clp protease proteolytic subunit [Planctomycetota bacterium]|jgi:ATP-dependent Clp protease protease subunit